MAAASLQQWEFENTVQLTDPTRDALYKFDPEALKKEVEAQPWKTDPHHFRSVRISAVALLKMVMHARSGGSLEVMGLMQGYVTGTSFVITDAFRLPVEGTETRVSAHTQADEYMVDFLMRARENSQLENAVGWYHSHPGYGCWLSGIDVSTQMVHQQYNDPFCAVVIDPDRTISAGKVEIGAFRTFPENFTPPDAAGGGAADGGGDGATDSEGFQTIPLAKIEDFGAYASRYYSLDVSHFKSTLDTKLLEALWNKYWVSTLAASPLFANRDYGTKQMADLAMKIKQADQSAQARSRAGGGGPGMIGPGGPGGPMGSKTAKGPAAQAAEQLDKIVKAGTKITAEEESGLLASEIKERLFSGVGVDVTTSS